MTKIAFKVVGLDCAEEISILKRALGKRSGITDIAFDILNAKMTIYASSHGDRNGGSDHNWPVV